jgi:hypothetical protein
VGPADVGRKGGILTPVRARRPVKSHYRDSVLLPVGPLLARLDNSGFDDGRIATQIGYHPRRIHALRNEQQAVSDALVDLIGCRVFGEPRLWEQLYPETDWVAVPVRSHWHCCECGESMIAEAPRCGFCMDEANALRVAA